MQFLKFILGVFSTWRQVWRQAAQLTTRFSRIILNSDSLKYGIFLVCLQFGLIILTANGKLLQEKRASLDQSWVTLVIPVKREAVAVAAPPDGKWVVHFTTIFGQLSCLKQWWYYFFSNTSVKKNCQCVRKADEEQFRRGYFASPS